MENIDFTIDEDDLKCLYIACKPIESFNEFVKDCKEGYAYYHKRNLDDLQKYGQPKTFSQWINGQIIYLT
jgi:hypothetical protein